ncbi:hypothetical protein B0H13DRAFT_1859057 [Mycena leptocephala]|nr:hypothetical protein B0H13DRAFT_1859057 [Mycena leptocephala]
MDRWTQLDEDHFRLPDGIRRRSYDADTGQYTYCDREGKLYRGNSNETYGLLTPVKDSDVDRPSAFAIDTSTPVSSQKSGSTFQEFVPAPLISPAMNNKRKLLKSFGRSGIGLRLRKRNHK